MTIPVRVQRSRKEGFSLPLNTVCVTRGTRYGNPFKIVYWKEDNVWNTQEGWYVTDGIKNSGPFDTADDALEESLYRFEKWARKMLQYDRKWLDDLKSSEHIACFCSLSEKCHADIYIKLLREIESGRDVSE
jgi:hypothetical protein